MKSKINIFHIGFILCVIAMTFVNYNNMKVLELPTNEIVKTSSLLLGSGVLAILIWFLIDKKVNIVFLRRETLNVKTCIIHNSLITMLCLVWGYIFIATKNAVNSNTLGISVYQMIIATIAIIGIVVIITILYARYNKANK